MKSPNFQISYNVLLDDRLVNELNRLAGVHTQPRSAIIRRLIHDAYRTECLGHPTCASGAPCLVPDMYRVARPVDQSNDPAPNASM